MSEKECAPSNAPEYRISASSNIHDVACHLSLSYLEGKKKMEILAIGAGAVNQAVKALVEARSRLAKSGLNIAVIPSFKDVMSEKEGKIISAMAFRFVEV